MTGTVAVLRPHLPHGGRAGAAVETFVDLYNEQWLPEKNGYLSPSATREAWYARGAQGVAA